MGALALAAACAQPAETDDPSPSETGSAPEREREWVPLASCVDPGLRETEGAYVTLRHAIPPARPYYFSGGGAAVGDVDGDGDHDLVVASITDVLLFEQTAPGEFAVPTVLAGANLEHPYGGWFGATLVDMEGDGDLDLHVTSFMGPDLMLRRDGIGWTDVSITSGLAGPDDHRSTSGSWVDIDSDGDLDVMVGGFGLPPEEPVGHDFVLGQPTRLHLNNGDGTFADRTERLASVEGRFTFVPSWTDADSDGDPDLYVVNDFGPVWGANALLINDGGHFTESHGTGLEVAQYFMGVAWGDLDGDGVEEAAMPGWGQVMLMKRSGSSWFDVSAAWGWQPRGYQRVGWSAWFADLDNDADLDLLTAFGFLDTRLGRSFFREPDGLFLQEAGALVAQEESVVADWGATRGLMAADVDGDGWQDVVGVNLDGIVRLHLARCGDAGSLTVSLRDEGLNSRGIGASVRTTSPDGARQLRVLRAGGAGYGVSAPAEAHFGLGAHPTVDVEVTWPDGEVTWERKVPPGRLVVRR